MPIDSQVSPQLMPRPAALQSGTGGRHTAGPEPDNRPSVGRLAMFALRALTGSWRRLLLASIAALGLTQLAYVVIAAVPGEPALDVVCAGWDRTASLGIALLVPDHTDVSGARLDFALYQLKRARNHCRDGRHDLARQYYDALIVAHPFPTRPDGTTASNARTGR